MTLFELLFATIVATAGAVGTTAIGIYASRHFGLPGIARAVDDQEARLVVTLTARLELAEEAAAAATSKAEAAERAAAETEQKRLRCEEEIARQRRDLRLTEGELLELYRETGKRPPKQLVTRHRDHVEQEDSP